MSGEPSVTLFSEGLLSKWGFNDGDEPEALLDYCDQHGIDWTRLAWHPILVKLVRQYLLPVLDQAVTVVEIDTIHNPIRAETVGGLDVTNDWYQDTHLRLTPESVTVPMAEVVKMVAESVT